MYNSVQPCKFRKIGTRSLGFSYRRNEKYARALTVKTRHTPCLDRVIVFMIEQLH